MLDVLKKKNKINNRVYKWCGFILTCLTAC